jgi:hypothetical protein
VDDYGDTARFSVSEPGDVISVPDDAISIVIEDQDDEPHGLLEKWGDDAWIYAPVDALREL